MINHPKMLYCNPKYIMRRLNMLCAEFQQTIHRIAYDTECVCKCNRYTITFYCSLLWERSRVTERYIESTCWLIHTHVAA